MMLLPPKLQVVVREDLSAEDCREILDIEPRYGRCELFYSWARVRPGFAAQIPVAGRQVGEPQRYVATTRGHRSAIAAVRAVARIAAA